MTAERSAMVAPGEGEVILRGSVGVIRKISTATTGGAFSVVEHPLEPGALAAPPHTHANADEYSFVIEGALGVLMGEETFRAAAGAYVLKLRGVPHTFWNPGPEPARVLEIISPADFEQYFEELAATFFSTPPGESCSSGGRPHDPRGPGRRKPGLLATIRRPRIRSPLYTVTTVVAHPLFSDLLTETILTFTKHSPM